MHRRLATLYEWCYNLVVSMWRRDRRGPAPIPCRSMLWGNPAIKRYRRRQMRLTRNVLLLMVAFLFALGTSALAGVPKIMFGEEYGATW